MKQQINLDLIQYREDFENKVIVASIGNNEIFKKRQVPAKKGRLFKSEFADFVGYTLEHKDIFAIDYYGFFKKSSGFIDKMTSFKDVEIKSMNVPVAHFASIKVELLSDIAPELVVNFSAFKRHLLDIRGFKHNKKA